MRLLHTSDWHLGRKLKEHDRINEFRKILEWLNSIISQENIDVLIVAGDIFDNRNPSIEAQELYYSFLAGIPRNSCRHIVITSGNHDSAPFIDAPSAILEHCNINVIGRPSDNEVITLNGINGSPELIVCAVPYLHDRYIRTVKIEDTSYDIERQIKEGIMNHYREVFAKARDIQKGYDIPVIATGHLFLEKGKTQNDEGEHTLYVGNAVKVGTDIFPDGIAYTALGHLHSPQKIGRENIRYSGSIAAMTFGELGVRKSVSIVDFDGRNFAGVNEIPIPVFQRMERVSGDWNAIIQGIRELGGLSESVWAEVTYTGSEKPGDIQERLAEILKDYRNVEVISVIDDGKYTADTVNTEGFGGKTLSDIDPEKILRLFMDKKKIPENDREVLTGLYREILHGIETGEN